MSEEDQKRRFCAGYVAYALLSDRQADVAHFSFAP
jgi:hypothetical protein